MDLPSIENLRGLVDEFIAAPSAIWTPDGRLPQPDGFPA